MREYQNQIPNDISFERGNLRHLTIIDAQYNKGLLVGFRDSDSSPEPYHFLFGGVEHRLFMRDIGVTTIEELLGRNVDGFVSGNGNNKFVRALVVDGGIVYSDSKEGRVLI